MKQWLMIQRPEKQYTSRSPSGIEKQLDCVVSDRRNRRYCSDAEANDMIHLGSDHRSVTQKQNLYRKYKIHERL